MASQKDAFFLPGIRRLPVVASTCVVNQPGGVENTSSGLNGARRPYHAWRSTAAGCSAQLSTAQHSSWTMCNESNV
jgi:hypothetical protein